MIIQAVAATRKDVSCRGEIVQKQEKRRTCRCVGEHRGHRLLYARGQHVPASRAFHKQTAAGGGAVHGRLRVVACCTSTRTEITRSRQRCCRNVLRKSALVVDGAPESREETESCRVSPASRLLRMRQFKPFQPQRVIWRALRVSGELRPSFNHRYCL